MKLDKETLVKNKFWVILATADPLAPTIVAAFQDYLQARGIFVDPARVRAPKDKGRVENQVSFVRESWFEGETFTSLLDTRRSAEHWSREIAGARVHGTTRLVPREAFERDEKPLMLAPPSAPLSVNRGKYAARATPIWALAAIRTSSAARISGRRSSNADERPAGTSGGIS